jgi:alcohol dehydrogenase
MINDYGVTPDKIAAMGGLFAANPCDMTHEDVVDVLKKSYR